MAKYKIELNEKQLRALSMVCDRYSRLICGQLDLSVRECCEEAWERHNKTPEHPYGIGSKDWYGMREEVERHLDELKLLCWDCGRNTDYGVGYDEYADMLYDMHQVIRHQLWLDNPDRSGITVDASSAMAFGEEELIKVERLEEN